jgi:hypothetical protein
MDPRAGSPIICRGIEDGWRAALNAYTSFMRLTISGYAASSVRPPLSIKLATVPTPCGTDWYRPGSWSGSERETAGLCERSEGPWARCSIFGGTQPITDQRWHKEVKYGCGK